MSHAALTQEKVSPWVSLLALVLIVLLAVSLRCSNLGLLRETYALDNDSYRFLRIAEADVTGRPIPERDSMRWWPAGRDMTTHLSLHSVVISRLYRISTHLGFRRPFRSFAIRFPVICYALCICVLYSFMARYISAVAGLIATAGLAVTALTVYRSSAGFVDRDPTCMLLFLCAYAAYAGLLCERRPIAGLAAAALCGAFSAALGLAWEAVGLFTVAFAVTLGWLAMSSRLTVRVLVYHLIWCAVAIPPLLWFTHAYRVVSQPYTALALLPVPLVCVSVVLVRWARQLGYRYSTLSVLRSSSRVLLFPLTATVVLLTGVAIALCLSPGTAGVASALLDNAISTCGRSPLERGISELQNMFLTDWWAYCGTSLIAFLAGTVVVASELGHGGTRTHIALSVLVVLCSTTILSSNSLAIWARPPRAEAIGLLDGGTLGGVIRLSTLPLWFLATVALGKGGPREERQGTPGQPLLFFLAVAWFLLLTTSAGAVRYTFYLTPIGWAVAGFGFCRLCALQSARDGSDAPPVRATDSLAMLVTTVWALWAVGYGPIRTLLRGTASPLLDLGVLTLWSAAALMVVLRSLPIGLTWGAHLCCLPARRAAAFGFLGFCLASNIVRAGAEAHTVFPRDLWLFPLLEKMEHRLPNKAVVLGWWDYGSEINVLARRTTIIDEDHYLREPRISEVARGAYCSDNPSRTAEFLGKNGVTHWLITDLDVHIMPHIASLAGTNASAGEMRVYDFLRVEDDRSAAPTMIRFLPRYSQRPQRLMDRLTLEGLGVSGSPVYISAIHLRLGKGSGHGASWSSPDVEVVLLVGKIRRPLRPEVVVFEGRTTRFSGSVLPGAVLVKSNQHDGTARVMYIPKRVSRCLAIRLFALNEDLLWFRPVDWMQNSSRQVLDASLARVWEVRHPGVNRGRAPVASSVNVLVSGME